jgi:uncharacterized protein
MPVIVYLRALIAILFIALQFPFVFAQGIQAVPALTARVIDQTSTLSAAESSALESRLSAFEQETGAQVVVLMVMTTAPEDIASYANRVANTWKIGRKDVGDGLLLLVAKQDRKIRIEVAKSLEGAVPDLAAKRVIDEAITPHFKQGRFAAGIDAAISQISALIRSESLPAPTADSVASAAPSQGFSWTDIGIFLFFAVPVSAAVARAVFGPVFGVLLVGLGTGFLAYLFTRSYLLAAFAGLLGWVWGALSSAGSGPGSSRRSTTWSGGSSSGSWSGSGSSSDFGSGGGGDFGGGGASGDW